VGGSAGAPEAADAALDAILRLLHERQGIDLSRYKPTYLRRRLLVRVRALRLSGLEAYARHLKRHAEEAPLLQRALSIKVTGFFRNPACFEFLGERVVPELLQAAAEEGRRVGVWSAGCATGEEAWSLAALFAAVADARRTAPRVDILGTDVDETAIDRARAASWPAAALADLPAAAAAQFEARGDGTVGPRRRLKHLVTFRRENLLESAGAGPFDLILCRNVLIYFGVDQQMALLSRFAASLRAGGCLMLGRVERLFGPARTQFELVSARDRIYRRLTAVSPAALAGEPACA
jgi:chemotaxis methyl-accepting protein methylase